MPTYENHLVLTANTTCDGEAIDCYQVVMTNARSHGEALRLAPNVADLRNDGCLPVVAYTAAELRALADDLDARTIEPSRSYNLSLAMTEEQMAARNNAEDEASASE